MSREKLKLN